MRDSKVNQTTGTKIGTTIGTIGDNNWVQNEMTKGHKIENWIQNEVTGGHKSWNNRIWDINWFQNYMSGCHQSWNKSWDKTLVHKLDSKQVDGWSQLLEQKLARQLCV